MMVIEPDENLTRTLTCKQMAFLSHIKSRSNDDDCFPLPPLETCFCSNPGSCQTQSVVLPSDNWVVYKLGALLGFVGHTVKIHKISTPDTGKELGDIEHKGLKKRIFKKNRK